MNIDTLRLFVEVARKLSFAAVAQERDINPSSVSRIIAQLEEHLALRLFQRTTRTMTLTEAGEAYFRRVSVIIEELEQAEEQARLANTGPMGTLKLTASVAFGERMIAPLVSTFRQSYPDVKLE
ncbi:MAG: LysR family transcriptional regulator, partial [Pseudomonadota bacterium]